LNTYLYIMELIFIKILGFFCDNEMLHKHTNGHGEIFYSKLRFKSYGTRLAGMLFCAEF
jgi:hypothetical protein